jgi:GT2 family glycosyltransferase
VNWQHAKRTFTRALRGADSDLSRASDNGLRVPRAICFAMSMYHDASRVRAFVDHLRRLALPPDVELHIVVADNGREPRTPHLRNAHVFTSPRNLGYLGGCVYALEQWRARGHAEPEWTCISNTDLELADDFLMRLAEEAWPDDGGVAAPDIRLVSGASQNPLLWRRPARAMMLAYAVLARSAMFAHTFELGVRVRHALRTLFGIGNARIERDAPIYAPHGSILAIHRRFFERGARLQYGAMMFGEEIHLAEQTRRAGLRVILRRDLRVVHDQHATLRKVLPSQRHLWLAESAAVLWRDYFAAGDS